MDKQDFDSRYEAYRREIETFLSSRFTDRPAWTDLYDSMRYSLLSGGKRIRPILVLEFARIAGLGENWGAAVPPACALEMVHTYSLIHDDLPCMDDDDLRRGKPTNHKIYGETMAVLAGDALQAAAYETILTAPGLEVSRLAEAARILAEASGPNGMVAGQVLDTLHAPQSESALHQVHALKTGAMMVGACTMGCACGGGDEALRHAAEIYAENLGLAFQIRDDMLDVMGDEKVLGKPIGSDQEEGKITFVDLLGLEGCDHAVCEATEAAKAAVAPYDESGFLRMLADALVHRNK